MTRQAGYETMKFWTGLGHCFTTMMNNTASSANDMFLHLPPR